MITKIDEKQYELIASVSDGEFSLLKHEVAYNISEELRDDANYAYKGLPKIMARIKLARFIYDIMGYRVIACTEYRKALNNIMEQESKYKYPRYEDFAMECAYAIAYRLYESDCEVDHELIDKVKRFYNP